MAGCRPHTAFCEPTSRCEDNINVDWKTFDPADYLDSEETIAAYLTACLEDDDASLFMAALGDVARARGMTKLAADTGLGRESLYKALAPGAPPATLNLRTPPVPRISTPWRGSSRPTRQRITILFSLVALGGAEEGVRHIQPLDGFDESSSIARLTLGLERRANESTTSFPRCEVRSYVLCDRLAKAEFAKACQNIYEVFESLLT